MALTSKIAYGPLRSIDTATLMGSYLAVGGPLEYSASIVKAVNNSNTTVTLSIDGVIDNDILPPNSFVLYDLTAGAPVGVPGTFFQKGTQFFVNGSAGVGLVYIAYLYVVPTTVLATNLG